MDPPASAKPPGAGSLLQNFPRNKRKLTFGLIDFNSNVFPSAHLIADGSRMTPPAEPFGMLSQPQAKNPPASAKPLGATNPLSTAPTKRRARFQLQIGPIGQGGKG